MLRKTSLACKPNSIFTMHISTVIWCMVSQFGENMLTKEKLKKLQKIQNRCTSLIMGSKTISDTYKHLKLLTVKQIIRLYNSKLGYKVQHSQLPVPILQACKTDSTNQPLIKDHPYMTRRKNEINRAKAFSNWYLNSFMVQSTKEFQNLPDSIRSIKLFPSFVKSCKNYLLGTQ